MAQMFDDDKATIRAAIGKNVIPEEIAVEYAKRMRMATLAGHSGPMGLWPAIEMLRSMGYEPLVKRVIREAPRWSRVRVRTPVIVDSPDDENMAAWFVGDLGEGILAVQMPHRPTETHVMAKFVRPATDDDDVSSLEVEQPAARMDEEVEDDDAFDESAYAPDRADDEPRRGRAHAQSQYDADDEDDEDHGWGKADIGREVLVEDGEAELTGRIVAVSPDGNQVTVEVQPEDGDSFVENYPAENVFDNAPPEIMVLAAQEAAAAREAEESAGADKVTI